MIDNSGNSCDLTRVAPAGYYIALRIGFVFPMEEHNTLPKDWVDFYTANSLMLHDPVIKWLYGNIGAVRWSEIEISDPLSVMRHANIHGLRFGAAVSCLNQGQSQRSIASFVRDDREFTEGEMQTLESHLQHLHDAKAPPTNLTMAELEALQLVKNGLLLKEIAHQLGVSQGAVKQRLKNAKGKLNARTSTHAATLAVEYGLI